MPSTSGTASSQLDQLAGWRAYSVARGRLGPAVRVSPAYGGRTIWPGDTFGLATLPDGRLAVSWGSAVGGSRDSQIWSAIVSVAREG